jgi:hypothetical protein
MHAFTIGLWNSIRYAYFTFLGVKITIRSIYFSLTGLSFLAHA